MTNNTGSGPGLTPAPSRPRRRLRRAAMLLLVALVVGAALVSPHWLPLVQGGTDERHFAFERSQRLLRVTAGLALPGEPDLANLSGRLAEHGLSQGAPILIRIFKREFELELWMQRDGVFHRFVTYPICRWSGTLGPKLAQGDGQAPEGFYMVDKTALNPNSRWYRSFNLGYPNSFDRAQGRTGSFLMVHGGCASVGCYAMTNAQMDEIWRLVNAALDGGQKQFQVQVYPFRMTGEKLASYSGDPNLPFWRDLKRGHDLFEATLQPPKASVCGGRYIFEPGGQDRGGNATTADSCPAASVKN